MAHSHIYSPFYQGKSFRNATQKNSTPVAKTVSVPIARSTLNALDYAGLCIDDLTEILTSYTTRYFASASEGSDTFDNDQLATLKQLGLPDTGDVSAVAEQRKSALQGYLALTTTSLTTAGVANLLKLSDSRIRQMKSAGTLYYLKHGRKTLYPEWQFLDGHCLPGLDKLVKAIPDDMNPLAVARFMIRPHQDLDNLSPVHFINAGNSVTLVIALLGEVSG